MKLNIHKCDRCGTCFDYETIREENYLKRDGSFLTVVSCKLRDGYAKNHLGGSICNEIQLELCPNCMTELLNKTYVDSNKLITLKEKMIAECNCQ